MTRVWVWAVVVVALLVGSGLRVGWGFWPTVLLCLVGAGVIVVAMIFALRSHQVESDRSLYDFIALDAITTFLSGSEEIPFEIKGCVHRGK